MYAKTTLTALCALLASTAFAGDENTMSGSEAALPSFASLDTNQDGAVTKFEVQNNGAVVDQWDTLDADRNGSVSSSEYSSVVGPNERHGETDTTDANGDDDSEQ
jgi:hypothetical protein